MVIAVIIAGVVGFFGELFFRMFTNLSWNSSGGSWGSSSSRSSSSSSSDSDSKGSGGGAIIVVVIAVALIMLAWLLSQIVKLALSRSREYLADAGSVELTKNPDAMITALRKIENRGELDAATSAVMELCFDNPREGFADLFATHPSVDSRVKALVQFAGGHDPGPLALPDDTEPEDQAEPAPPDRLTPPVPRGHWSDAASPAGSPPALPQGTQSGPLRPLQGPWGRRR
jgi:heat shock protein HtpX